MEKALSDEYYKLRSSRDFYTGTSFKMSTWDLNTRYFNDENIIDFVSYEGCLLYCTRSHISSESNEPVPIIENDIIVGIHPNIFWKFVMGTNGKGLKGDKGDTGPKGQIIYPEGIYNVNTVYQGTVDKTPYVYDSNDANYYVLNIVGTWQGTLHSNESPSTDTSNS